MQYPLDAEGEEDIYQKRHEGHESFMKAKADAVLGRGELLDKVGTQQAFFRLWWGKTRVIGPSKPGLLV